MENVTIKNNNEKNEILNHKIELNNRNTITITGITKMLSANETNIVMTIKTTKSIVSGKDLHIEKLDVENGFLDATGTIDSIKYSGNDNIVKRIFK